MIQPATRSSNAAAAVLLFCCVWDEMLTYVQCSQQNCLMTLLMDKQSIVLEFKKENGGVASFFVFVFILF
jgi:hypothetical protein